MVNFPPSMGSYEVLVNNKRFGWITDKRGFFTDSMTVKQFMEVSSSDLRLIADFADEVIKRSK
jgi:hypothetical protein